MGVCLPWVHRVHKDIYILKYMDSEMIFYASKISEGILWAEISKLLFIGAEKDDV